MMQSAKPYPLSQPNIHAMDATPLMHERSRVVEIPSRMESFG